MGADAESGVLSEFSGAAGATVVSGIVGETEAFSELAVLFFEFAEMRRPFFAAAESPFAAGALPAFSAPMAEDSSGFGVEGASAP